MLIITKTCRVCGSQHSGTHEDLKAHFYVRVDNKRKLFNTCRPCHIKAAAARVTRERQLKKAQRLRADTPA